MPEDTILGGLGYSWTSIWGPWSGLGSPFWGSGGTPGCVPRAVVAKDHFPLSRPPVFGRFSSRKGAQKAPTIKLKSIKNRFNIRSKIWLEFVLVSGVFLVDCWRALGTLDPPE